MKKTKWTTHTFTKKERKARKQWQTADRYLMELFDALELYPNFDGDAREQLQEQLDKRLDSIAALVNKAKDAFPEVEKSFTIVTDTIKPR